MTKIYEALQHAYGERELGKNPKGLEPMARQTPNLLPGLDGSVLSIESEMFQLQQRMAGLLSNSQTHMIQFMSSSHGEGTSTILRELGKVWAKQSNKSVLLIDMNSQYSDQHQAFGIRPKLPLASIVREGGAFDEAISQIKNSRLSLCQLFDDNTHPDTGWLAHDRQIGESIRRQFDLILVDSPPINASVEGLTLCSSVDGVVLVIEAEKTRSPIVLNLKERIIESGGHLLGIVFNKQRYYIPEWLYKRLS